MKDDLKPEDITERRFGVLYMGYFFGQADPAEMDNETDETYTLAMAEEDVAWCRERGLLDVEPNATQLSDRGALVYEGFAAKYGYSVKANTLVLYTIYKHPTDYPASFVTRAHIVHGGDGSAPVPVPLAVTDELESARKAVPRGLHNLGRDWQGQTDERQVVETWI